MSEFGIRMHYLRNTNHTLQYLSEAGYLFDSTIFRNEDTSKISNLWEFPLQLMDSSLFNQNGKWQKVTLEQAKETTLRNIEKAENKVKYFTLLFHDRYFSNSFTSWKEWYIWIVDYFKKNGFEFINYRNAIRELENQI